MSCSRDRCRARSAGRPLCQSDGRDRGSGDPDEVATKIFDPYFTTKPLGSGLGLAIGYSIIKKHGGMLLSGKFFGEGATFAFYLPAVEGEVAHQDIPIPRTSLFDPIISGFWSWMTRRPFAI